MNRNSSETRESVSTYLDTSRECMYAFYTRSILRNFISVKFTMAMDYVSLNIQRPLFYMFKIAVRMLILSVRPLVPNFTNIIASC